MDELDVEVGAAEVAGPGRRGLATTEGARMHGSYAQLIDVGPCSSPVAGGAARRYAGRVDPTLADSLLDIVARVARLEALDVDTVADALGGRPGPVEVVRGNGVWKICELALDAGLFATASVSWHPEEPDTRIYVACSRPRHVVPRAVARAALKLAERPHNVFLSWFKAEPHTAEDVLLGPRDALHLGWTADERARRWVLQGLTVPRAWPDRSLFAATAPTHAVQLESSAGEVALRVPEVGPLVDMQSSFPHGARPELLRHHGDTMREMFEDAASSMWDVLTKEDEAPPG